MLGAGWPGTGGRLYRPRPPPLPSGPTGPASGPEAAAVASAPIAEATSGGGRPWPTVGAGPTRSGCLVPNRAATPPAAGATGAPPGPRWSTWPAGAATATTATSGTPTVTDPAATSATGNATAASWQKGAVHAPAPRPERLRGRGGPGGTRHAGLPRQRPVGAGPDRRGAPAVPGRPRRPARPAAGQRLGRPGPTGAAPRGSPDPTGGWT